MSEIEARLARRLAIAFWKGERAERIEVALFDAAPSSARRRPATSGSRPIPLTTFDLKRFNAVRGYQAQQGREISRCLKELRQLRKEALAECTDEPEETAEATLRNEPEGLPEPANDHAPRLPPAPATQPGATPRNEPGAPAAPPMARSGRSTACRCSTSGGSRAGIRSRRPGSWRPLRSSWTTRRVAVQRVTAPGPLAVSEVAAELPFPVHPTMLRHACGFALAEWPADEPALLNRVSSSWGSPPSNRGGSIMDWDCRTA